MPVLKLSKKNKNLYFIFITILSIFISISANAQMKECRCHSKNSKMRRMHEIIGFKDCGNCHSKNENLMAPHDKESEKDREKRLEKRIKEDRFCVPCHNPDGTIKKESYKESEKMRVANTLYCPKDKLKFTGDIKVCPKCGGELLNINRLMEESRKAPSNDICRKCHLDEEVLKISKHKDIDKKDLFNCLACHEGHNDCAGCHH